MAHPSVQHQDPATRSRVAPRHLGARVLACMVLISAGCGRTPPAKGADLLIVTVHGLRADHIESLTRRAPRTAELLSEALRFRSARTPCPQTSAALASLLGGRLPRRHGVLDEQTPFDPAVLELPLALRAAARRTAAVLGPELGGRPSWTQAFEESSVRADDAERIDWARRWLADEDSDQRPALLWLHLSSWTEDWSLALEAGVDPEQVRERYDAALARLGTQMEALWPRDAAADRRITLLTADHGWLLGERHGDYGHDGWLYEETLRVPLALHDSEQALGAGRVGADVSLHDVPTTLGRLVGVPVKARDGASDLLESVDTPPVRLAVFETFQAGSGFDQQAVLADRLKLHRAVSGAPGWPLAGRPDHPRLFALDGGREGRDLAPGEPRTVDALERLFAIWRARHGEPGSP